jgi:hypothetical protein
MASKTTYLEHYQAGEYEPVWAELQVLGAAVRAEPLYSDALAVAHETMRRVRQNLEWLIPRLVAVGYQFGYGWIQPPADEALGWQLRREYVRMVAEAQTQPPILTIASDVAEHLTERQERLRRLRDFGASPAILANEERQIAELEAQPRATTLLREMEERVGVLPLSVRAWYEVVGGVNLVGVHPGWMQLLAQAGELDADELGRGFVLAEGGHPMHMLEPLQVWPLGRYDSSGHAVLQMHTAAGSAQRLELMPNQHAAYLEGGQDSWPYEMEAPCAGVDAPLLFERHETTFVGYLRVSLRWAGFPGWERTHVRPEHDLATLLTGLLPF